jgi:hypothetical protein
LLADNDIDRGFVVGIAKDGHRQREDDAQLSISGPTAVIVGLCDRLPAPRTSGNHRDSHRRLVMPARNEESRLPRCLDAPVTAKTVFQERHPEGPAVRIIVVVDLSTDRTLHVAEQWPGIETVLSACGRVGAAEPRGWITCWPPRHTATGPRASGSLAPTPIPRCPAIGWSIIFRPPAAVRR